MVGRLQKRTPEDRIFDIINILLLSIVCLLVLYPLYFVIIASFSNPDGIYQGKMWLVPYKPNLAGYRVIFATRDIWIGYRNSLIYTAVSICISVTVTLMTAFPLSRRNLVGRSAFTFYMAFTMYFSGGMIPIYLVVKGLGMLDTMWSLVLPVSLGVYNVIIVRTFFNQTVPEEVYESAVIDGCSNARYFLRILLPLSTAVIAVMVLFYGVGQWNSFFSALLYIETRAKMPLQLILREILVAPEDTGRQLTGQMLQGEMDRQRLAELIQYGVIIVASIPVLVLYPFVQKYFVKGVMIGSIKG